ncbi:formylmethanofuran--tetrahydromethanopterin N-formyltransferase [Candidatus Bathyarchaeota archaeon]|nr:formylmethanofuran--tetrahydromethanopterin N-formyltransferase [Candidatus Bathyarchaeota archaeon]
MVVPIQDTYAEAFTGICTRIIVTARDETRLKKAAYNSTSLPSIVINRTEGGIEQWIHPDKTPDGRMGAILQYYGRYDPTAPEKSLDRFNRELSYRIRQGILVVPTTAVYNASNSKEKIDMMDRVGHCGDGYETEIMYRDLKIISVPLMMGDFYIERYLGVGKGIMGGNIWILCCNEDAALEAGDKAVAAVMTVPYAISTFDICSAGSKPETKFPEIGPTTNHYWCPTLRGKIPDSQVPNGVNCIPEIVINGVTLEAVKEAMKAAAEAVRTIQGVIKVSAGNYSGKLGQYKIYLKELFP